jgi:hypothetical protein
VPRTAPHIANRATGTNLSGEAIEQLAIEWLVLKLVSNTARVLLGDPIVALAD